ncbi:MAG: L,D-transpeptidase family protein [Verrucomicrobiales bacterium]|nr:L,D-transpeptidase family protein [Verrucomicrobiales bacterium]
MNRPTAWSFAYGILAVCLFDPATAQTPDNPLTPSHAPAPRARVIENAAPVGTKPLSGSQPAPTPDPIPPQAPTVSSKAGALTPVRAELPQTEEKTAPEPDKDDLEAIIRLQIFLDEHNFGPGNIDGKMGEFTRKAGEIFNQVHGIEKGNWYYLLKASRKLITTTYAAYRLKDNDFRFVMASLPTKPSQQAQCKYLGYRSILEFVAERFHTSEECLVRVNPGLRWEGLRPRDLVMVPNVKSPFLIEDVPYSLKFETDPLLSARRVTVDTKERVATFHDETGKLFASFPITPGEKKFLHFGEWEVTNMVTTPEFRWDEAMLNQGKRSEQYHQLPPGPNNPVGIFWAGTSKTGIGLHGTATPHTIGRSQSHGCVRLANWDAIRLPDLIRPGAKVLIK